MSLQTLVDNSRTDKNTTHSYLPLYDVVLDRLRESAKNVLEIGVGQGGSILLWKQYFPNAHVYGLDILPKGALRQDIFNDSRITMNVGIDAYDKSYFQETFLDNKIQFDYMLDDGPHTLESMIQFIQLYSQLMTQNGILIIEDVQSIDWIPKLIENTPVHLKQYIQVYDLRPNKGRYDDIVFTIDKRQA